MRDVSPVPGEGGGNLSQECDKASLPYSTSTHRTPEEASKAYEIHHVNKVKNLKGKRPWEIVMIAKRRKTLVVCKKCHYAIHHP